MDRDTLGKRSKRLQKRVAENNTQQKVGKVYSSYDVIGDVAIIKVPDNNLEEAKKAAEAIMGLYHNLKSVFLQSGQIAGDFRVRRLHCLAGEDSTVTVHCESGCVFVVDVEKCYFSPRLQFERRRIAGLVKSGEVVVNMFAGVGCFSVEIAKAQSNVKVYSIDINPTAFECMQENVKLNRVYGRVIPLLGDSKQVIASLQGTADRVLMPLPELALEYLPCALKALKPSGGWIHYYDFEHANSKEEAIAKTKLKVDGKLAGLGVDYGYGRSRVIRSTGPNWYQTVLDIHVKFLPSNF